MPNEACSKKCRRVTTAKIPMVVPSLFGDRLVQVEQHVGDQRPRREIRVGVAALPVARALLLVDRHQPIDFPTLRRARQHQLHAPRGARGRRAASRHHPPRQRPRRFERRRIVQQRQRLQRRVGADAAHRAELAAGRVEGHEARIRRRAPPERIQAAAVAILAAAGGPLVGVVRHVPDAVRLDRVDARAEHLAAEQTARRQRRVANHLGFQAHARAAREQPVVRIALGKRRRDGRRLPVGRRHHDRLDQRLLAPALRHQLGREPVEQLGMRRRRALRSEVLAGLDQAASEQLLPQAVDDDARHERVVRIDEPSRKTQAVGWQVVAHRVQRPRRARIHALALGREAAAHAQLERGALEPRLLAHDQRRRNLAGRRAPSVAKRARRASPSTAAWSLERAPRARRSGPWCARSPGRPAHGAAAARGPRLRADRRDRSPRAGTGRCPDRWCRRDDR